MFFLTLYVIIYNLRILCYLISTNYEITLMKKHDLHRLLTEGLWFVEHPTLDDSCGGFGICDEFNCEIICAR